jgi:ATP-dependent exoDNAse (exonuclease V) alpha subunit
MKQEKALNILKAGKNVFLTGSAGAGKTYTLNQYIQYLKARKVSVAVTASTGIAATHMNGVTIHTWAGIGIKDSLSKKDLEAMRDRKYLREHLENAKVLIIDEISMLHAKQLEMVNQVLKYFKENDEPFGGIQVIFSGDFFQLPPVGDNSETNREKFAFMAKAWVEAGLNVCYLSEQHRQSESELDDILNEIRKGAVSEKSMSLLEGTKDNKLAHVPVATKLYTHNMDVDKINVQHLAKLTATPTMFKAETKGNVKLQEMLKNTVRTDEELELKLGAKVMFIKNNYEKGYFNGTLGEISGFTRHEDHGILPKVTLCDGKELTVEPELWSIEDEGGKVLAAFKQVPLRLAWAITVHKSQGMTLEAAEIDLRKTFEKGQGYVALSRLKDLSGLRLIGFNRTALELDPLAMRADQRFRELSNEAQMQWTDDLLTEMHKGFVTYSGGIWDEKEIKKHAKKLKEKKGPKKSTYLLTKELIDQGLKVAEIAEERGITSNTIIGHFEKIAELYPDTNLHQFRPKSTLIKKVEKAYLDLEKNHFEEAFYSEGKIKMTALYEALNGAASYEELKLALFFKD